MRLDIDTPSEVNSGSASPHVAPVPPPYIHDGIYAMRNCLGTPVLHLPNKQPIPGVDRIGASIAFDILSAPDEKRWRVVNHLDDEGARVTYRRSFAEAIHVLMEWGLPPPSQAIQQEFMNGVRSQRTLADEECDLF